jgi:hypothetical protein
LLTLGDARRTGQAIQELADLSTTKRYMHLSPAGIDAAIRLLDSPGVLRSRGEIVEKDFNQKRKANA